MSNYQEPTQWADFLAAFSLRNQARRARLQRFDFGGVQEEGQETQLTKVAVELTGPDAPLVIITRLDHSTMQPRTVVTTIKNVARIETQFDPAKSDEALKIEDKHSVLTLLRFASLASQSK